MSSSKGLCSWQSAKLHALVFTLLDQSFFRADIKPDPNLIELVEFPPLTRDAKKWIPVFRENPALNI